MHVPVPFVVREAAMGGEVKYKSGDLNLPILGLASHDVH
jgi:hypothetical protein